ncbi:TAXI family TRAP transporter solute-binding subunit [Gelria sp. Kuro-4]|uniref:TAXI family TRAP transporter solute-binding subunit n=1 Tax=Gelria sp. Kuro-4 TaxID=2796927 RepID=UPI001BF0E507|nr:TAXI family TRAP transporter solute-binding subunit [Gelria sp. Kuro-4]BCV25262.1 C4-dicarboxylate ABC transporter substrate-binding protein [Gelria sp. Kuro-4]
MRVGRVLLVIALCLLLLAGCTKAPATGAVEDQKKTEPSGASSGSTALKMAVGGAGGGWYIAGAAMGAQWEKSLKGVTTTLVPGGGVANPTRVNNHQEDIGFTYTTNAVGATKGLPPYTQKAENLRGMINLNIKQFFHFMVLADKNITSFEQLAQNKIGLKISPGPRGSGSEATTALVLKEYGLNYENLKKWGGFVEFSSPGDAVDKIRDGHLDTYACLTTAGDPSTTDLAVSRKMVFLELNEKVRDAMVSQYGYSKGAIPAGKYEGQDEEIPTVYDGVLLVVNKDVPEDLVYNLVKTLCENAEELKKVHAIFKDFDPKVAPQMPLQLHPGAEKYYKEKGLL